MEHLPSSAEYTVIWEVESPYLKEDKITTIKKKKWNIVSHKHNQSECSSANTATKMWLQGQLKKGNQCVYNMHTFKF